MQRRSNLVYLSAGFLGAAFLMLSCASSSQPDQLKVHVPQHCSGVHVATCVSGAPSVDVTVDEQGVGKTSLCPGANHTVEIEVVGDNRHYKLMSPEVHIQRTGDGIATSIEAQLPE
jgi:hypothetical protein